MQNFHMDISIHISYIIFQGYCSIFNKYTHSNIERHYVHIYIDVHTLCECFNDKADEDV